MVARESNELIPLPDTEVPQLPLDQPHSSTPTEISEPEPTALLRDQSMLLL